MENHCLCRETVNGNPAADDDVRLIGNFWGNAVSTDKSTWSGVKGQFNK
jgi:hypothetical protein